YDRQRAWERNNPPPTIHVHMDESYLQSFLQGYKADAAFKQRWETTSQSPDTWDAGQRYFKDEKGLLYFRDADFQPRLCVPKSLRAGLLLQAHESPFESAHAG
ncbi:hypothetical protein FA95DRAFT_1458873, partial [Auriscalpium vulgare]